MPLLRTLALFILPAAALLPAQSLKIDEPAPMRAGSNTAVIDSFGGNQFWVVTVGPGAFKVSFLFGNRQEGFNTGGRPTMFTGFKPKVIGTTLTHADTPNGNVWSGTATTPSRLVVAIVPAPGSLVRQTTPYTLEATGAVSFATTAAAAGPPVAGVYQIMSFNRSGIAKFAANGEITTTDGETGTWKLFDADSKSYVIVFAGQRHALTFQPGRGFVDGSGVLAFIAK